LYGSAQRGSRGFHVMYSRETLGDPVIVMIEN
jgi:hypothetical protein